jgi:hypothetical protein
MRGCHPHPFPADGERGNHGKTEPPLFVSSAELGAATPYLRLFCKCLAPTPNIRVPRIASSGLAK